MANKKLYIPLLVFLGLIIAFMVQLMRNSNGEDPKALESALIGKAVPITQAMPDLFDANITHQQRLFIQNKPLLLNVWATWCPTCFAEHQYLNLLSAQDVSIIGVNYKDDPKKAVEWLKDLGNPYQQVILDQKGTLGLDLGVYGAPETFVIDCAGIIRDRYAGDVNDKVWQTRLKPLYEKLKGEAQCKKSS